MPYLGNEVAPLVQALEGKELKLDSDGDSSITADTDDRVDVKVGGSDIAHVTSTGLGVGTTSPNTKLHIVGLNQTNGTVQFEADSAKGTNDSFVHYGTNGDWFIRSSSASGDVIIQDTGGDVGIGTSSPDSKLNIETTKTTALSSEAHFTTLGLCIDDNTAYNTSLAGGGIAFRHIKNSSGDMNVYGAIDGVRTDAANGRVGGHLRFFTNNDGDGIPKERMRIDSSGTVLISDTQRALTCRAQITYNGGSEQGLILENLDNSASGAAIRFVDTDGDFSGGGIYYHDSNSINYQTTSDYRLKENIVTDWDATTSLKKLKPSKFNFKKTPSKTVQGFIAHEVSDIVPEAIIGVKDGTEKYIDDKDGKEKTREAYQSIDQSKLVPLLTKALQEAIVKIETLEAEVAKLKG